MSSTPSQVDAVRRGNRPRTKTSSLKRAVSDAAIPLSLIGLTIIIWEISVRVLDVPEYLLPTPSAIAEAIWVDRQLLLDNLKVTMVETLAGFALAFVLSTAHGIALGYSQLVRRATYPLIVTLQVMPTLAIAPILTIWFGYTLTPKIIITALICFFPLTVNIAAGFAARDPEAEHLFRVLGAGWGQRFFKLALPSALPQIFTGIKISITLAVIGAFVSEWAGSSSGLGHLILIDTSQIFTVRVFAAIVILSGVGILLFAMASLLEKLLTPWRHRNRRRGSRHPLPAGAVHD